MRSVLLSAAILMLTAGLAAAQHAEGTKLLGGSVSFYKDMTDYGDGYGMTSSQLSIAPTAGYFVMDNVAILGSLRYSKTSFTDEYKNATNSDDPDASTGFGIGAQYHVNYFYGGAHFLYSDTGDADAENALVFEGGYLLPITEFFFLDLGLDYYLGLSDRGVEPSTYKQRYMTAGLGFVTFFQ